MDRVAVLAARDDGSAAGSRVLRTLLGGVRTPARRCASGSRACPAPTPPPACCSTSSPAADRRPARRLGWRHVRPLRVEPAARGPRRGVRGRRERIAAPLAADYNVAPTKEVYAVVERPPSRETSDGAAAAPAARAHVGPGAVVGQGPLDRQPDDQRPDGDGRREAGLPQAFADAPRLLPADGYFEWYPTAADQRQGKPVKQPFFIRPNDGGVLAMAGLYEIWRDPTKAEDDPDRFRWTCTVLTTRPRTPSATSTTGCR